MEPISLKSAPVVGRAALRLQSDDRLTRLCSEGFEPAFDEIVRRYWGPLVGFAGTIVGADKAEDVVQDSLMRAQGALAGEQREIALKPWLYKIVRNAALNDIRDNRKHDHVELDDTYDGVERPEEAAERQAELASTVAAISSLPEAQRRALVGRELEGRSHAEIADDLNVTEGATKQLIHRARVGVRAAVGALIPLGLIRSLLGPAASAEAATAAAGAGIGASAGAGGLLTSLGGAGVAKVAAVAVLAGGTAVGGVEVSNRVGNDSGGGAPIESGQGTGGGGEDALADVDGAAGDEGDPADGEGPQAEVGEAGAVAIAEDAPGAEPGERPNGRPEAAGGQPPDGAGGGNGEGRGSGKGGGKGSGGSGGGGGQSGKPGKGSGSGGESGNPGKGGGKGSGGSGGGGGQSGKPGKGSGSGGESGNPGKGGGKGSGGSGGGGESGNPGKGGGPRADSQPPSKSNGPERP